MLEDVLRAGFALANRRPGLIFLDILWKAIWLIGTLGALLFIGAWFGSAAQSIGWQDTGAGAGNAWLAAALLREFWNATKTQILWSVFAVLALSKLAWLILEAVFRSRMVDRPNVKVFLVSGAAKAAIFGAAAVVLILVSVAGATTIAVVVFVLLAFSLTLIDTLIRTDAVDLLGTDLIRVTGLIGILLLFETMIVASLALLVAAGILNVGQPIDALVMLGVGAFVVVFLNVLHSYLLLVRFSAVGIMRRNVVEV